MFEERIKEVQKFSSTVIQYNIISSIFLGVMLVALIFNIVFDNFYTNAFLISVLPVYLTLSLISTYLENKWGFGYTKDIIENSYLNLFNKYDKSKSPAPVIIFSAKFANRITWAYRKQMFVNILLFLNTAFLISLAFMDSLPPVFGQQYNIIDNNLNIFFLSILFSLFFGVGGYMLLRRFSKKYKRYVDIGLKYIDLSENEVNDMFSDMEKLVKEEMSEESVDAT